MKQRTFSMIKPDAVAKNVTGAINKMIEEAGLTIIAQKRIQMTPEQAGEFYAEHKGKPFYDGLVEMMSSGPIIVQVLEGEDAITKYRTIMGVTDPQKAAPGTIRATYGSELPYNAVHGSDSPESAAREMGFFFSIRELHPNKIKLVEQFRNYAGR